MNIEKATKYISKFCSDALKGGLADNSKKVFDKKQLAKGRKVEMEHTNDPQIAEEIARDHLTEDPKYYIKLEKCVESFVKNISMFKLAQVGSPSITIQPGKPEANCALDILKLWNPSYFTNVEKIVIGPSPNYGYVESGPEKDPAVIYINADRIVSEAGQQSGKEAAIATASVIAHEKGHVSSFDPEKGFVGGEAPAEAEERSFQQWLESGGIQKVENLQSFQNLK